jgi:outer membrane biosynthesis protein TonB
MDRISNIVSRRAGSWPSLFASRDKDMLPFSSHPEPKWRSKSLLSNCLYRRVVIWGIVVVVGLSLTLFNPQLSSRSKEVLNMVHLGQGESSLPSQVLENLGLQKQDGKKEDPAPQAGPDSQSPKGEKKEGTKQQDTKGKAKERVKDKSAKKPVGKPVKKPSEKPAEKAEEKSPEKTAEKQIPNDGPRWLQFKQ